jgi:hypothetical protein
MRPANKRKKRTKAEQKERRRHKTLKSGAPSLTFSFTPVTDEVFAADWTAATWQNIIALCGDHVDGGEIMDLAETILWRNVDLTDRPAIDALASASEQRRTERQYWPQLIDAAILAAADPVFVSEYGKDALSPAKQISPD